MVENIQIATCNQMPLGFLRSGTINMLWEKCSLEHCKTNQDHI